MTDASDTTHVEFESLLGAYALDALEPSERERLEEHLAGCPRCRAEVDAHRETAAALGNLVEEPPGELWQRIADQVDLAPRQADPAAPPRLAPWADAEGPAGSPPAAVVPLDRARRPRPLPYVVSAVAAAAVITIALLAVNLGRVDHQVTRLQQAVAGQTTTSVAGTAVTLRSPGGAALAGFTLYPDGRGIMDSSRLRPLPSTSVYQLWAVNGSHAVSVGLMGRDPRPGHVAFTWATTAPLHRLAVTVEPAGGTAAPTTTPVAVSGPLTA